MRRVSGLLAVERGREIGAEPAIGARRARIPSRPHQRVAASQTKAEPGVLLGFRVVGAGRVVGRDVVEQVEDALRAAIGHVVDQDRRCRAAGPSGRRMSKSVAYSTSPLALRGALSRSTMHGILRRVRVERAARDALDADIGAGRAELVTVGEVLDVGDADIGDRHGGSPYQSEGIGASWGIRARSGASAARTDARIR